MQDEKGTVIGEKSMKNEEYKKLSIKEFTKVAGRYESSHAGIYEMCKKDYPDILEELEKEPFRDLLDAGCGPAPMISLLAEKYPDRHYTGLDLTPAMIEQAKKKNISNATFVVGDCENFPFENDSFDAIICSMSFHHYPNPQAFFDSVKRCLRPNGNLIIEFDRNNTYIQSEGINQDFGVYDCPDELLKEHHQEISAFKAFAYRHIGRHLMNRNVRKMRER